MKHDLVDHGLEGVRACAAAACRRYSAAQRARTIAPRLGTQPMPTQAHEQHPVRPRRSARRTSSTAADGRRHQGRRAQYPALSVPVHQPETCGPATAAASAMVADSAPASPYRPVSWEIIVTTPMPIIDSGIRPRKPAAEKPLVPGGGERGRGRGWQRGLRGSGSDHG